MNILMQTLYLNFCRFLLSRNSLPADYCLARTVSSQVPPRLLPSAWHQPNRVDRTEYDSAGHESLCVARSAWHHSGLNSPTGRVSVLFCLSNHGRLYSVPHDSLWGGNSFSRRRLHTSRVLCRDESKVEETLEAIKDQIKKDEQVKPSDAQISDGSAPSADATASVAPTGATTAVKKKSIRERIVAEVKHYYHGFRLLFIDFRVCARLLWQVLNGKTLMRREQKQVPVVLSLKHTCCTAEQVVQLTFEFR